LYAYEFETKTFSLLDECPGYYISYEIIEPVSVRQIDNPYEEIMSRKDLTLKTLPNLRTLANKIKKSSLNFSLIRMRNALGR